MDRADVHRAQGVDFLIDAHRADFRRHRRADTASDQNGHHHWRQFFADREADHTPNRTAKPPFHQQRTGLQGDDAANKKRQDADHQQAGIADLEELVEYFLALTPRERQRQQRAPEQNDHFSDILKHDFLSLVKLTNQLNRVK